MRPIIIICFSLLLSACQTPWAGKAVYTYHSPDGSKVSLYNTKDVANVNAEFEKITAAGDRISLSLTEAGVDASQPISAAQETMMALVEKIDGLQIDLVNIINALTGIRPPVDPNVRTE